MSLPTNAFTIGRRFYSIQPEAAMLPFNLRAKDCIPRPQLPYVKHIVVPDANGDYGVLSFSPKDRLTQIQSRIFVLSALGMEVNAIADTFYNSRDTVKSHRGIILDKLDVPDFAGAASAAFNLGMLSVEKGLSLQNHIRPREIAVLQAGAVVNDRQENANTLGVAYNTVRSHRGEVFQSLNVTGMEDAVVLGHLYGLLATDSSADASNAA